MRREGTDVVRAVLPSVRRVKVGRWSTVGALAVLVGAAAARVGPAEAGLSGLASPRHAVAGQGGCVPRPPVMVTTLPGAGRLQVTVDVSRPPALAQNALRAIRFGTGANALIDAGAVIGATGGIALNMPPSTEQFSFVVRAAGPGAVSLPLVAVDDCGDWPTWVGGGPNALAGGPPPSPTAGRPVAAPGPPAASPNPPPTPTSTPRATDDGLPAAPAPPLDHGDSGTRVITVERGGRSFQTVALDPAIAPDGRPMRAGSVLVKFRAGAAQVPAHQAAGATAIDGLRLPDSVRVQVPRATVAQALAAYRARPDVEFAEPDYLVKRADTPNDPLFGQQWGMTKISAPPAWNLTHSAPSIRIAVLDCGIYSSTSTFGPGHPDVRDKVVLERNFTTAANADDYCNHGTHVAGIAAASTNNTLGVAGAGYDATILNGKVLDDSGTGSVSWLVNGIMWAADNGAKVINMSLGSAGACLLAYQQAVDYAWDRGAVSVAAAGNDGIVGAERPANCNRVLAVAATDESDAKASFSNYGTNVDLAAPGVGILSTNFTGGYSSFSGTSMATPHVAGLAALVWATASSTSNQAVVDRITLSADPIGGTGSQWQYGRINAQAATVGTCAVRPPVSVTNAVVGGALHVTITAQTSSTAFANSVTSLTFGAASNALIDVGGISGSSGNVTVPFPQPAPQVTFVVHRGSQGAGVGTTVPLIVNDQCGAWPTFVGGGPAAPF